MAVGPVCGEPLSAGNSLITGKIFDVPGNVEHQASALEDSEILDIFTPYREGYATIYSPFSTDIAKLIVWLSPGASVTEFFAILPSSTATNSCHSELFGP